MKLNNLTDNFFVLGAIVLGPRIDRFKDEDTKYISGHSIPLTSLGGFILIFGFFAFNAGSQVKQGLLISITIQQMSFKNKK